MFKRLPSEIQFGIGEMVVSSIESDKELLDSLPGILYLFPEIHKKIVNAIDPINVFNYERCKDTGMSYDFLHWVQINIKREERKEYIMYSYTEMLKDKYM